MNKLFYGMLMIMLLPCTTKAKQGQDNDTVAREVTGIRAILITDKMEKSGVMVEGVNKDGSKSLELKLVKPVSIFTWDAKSLAMHVDQAGLQKKLREIPASAAGSWFYDTKDLKLNLGDKMYAMDFEFEERPMYFDYEGYVYTQGRKGRWLKTPVLTLYKFMSKSFTLSIPDPFAPFVVKVEGGNYSYYGIDVSPGRYPILEWAIRYRMENFEGSNHFRHEFIAYGGEGGASKYTLLTGEQAGSFVVFDGMSRLQEINTVNSGMIQYSYGNYKVSLPDPKKVDYFSGELQLFNLKENN